MLSEIFFRISLQSLPTVEGAMPQALLEYAENVNPDATVCVPH